MYERSAIVLERYFENLFGLNKPSNLEQNFKNYCELYEKFNNYQNANNDEFQALEEFQAAENAIEDIQAQEEKLYKKNAKYEYNRDLIFNDITQKPEEIEKCMEKIENDIAKSQATLVTLREKFVEAVRNYNDKKSALAKCKKARKNAESEYNAIFDVTKQNIENIPEEFIAFAKAFSEDSDQEELVETMLENGKDEKIPFNNAVVRNAVKVGYDIEARFIDAYIDAYNKTKKLIAELMEGAVSIELHGRTIRNIRVKLNFLNAEKDYLVQFLDYERIMVIHGKRTHRNLMLEACDNFNIDVEQINNLYTLLIKEITGKSTKKAYKELYNKSYLVDIEENDEKFKKEKTKINLSTATVMNTNYWRLEGIKNIYTVFYKDVVEVFGKDLDEFEVPREPEEADEMAYENIEAGEIGEESIEAVENVEVIAEPEVVEEEPEEVFVLDQVSDDIPALPGMAEAVQENEKGAKKAAKAKKKAEEDNLADENIQVIEQELSDTESYNDIFDEIEIAPEPVPAKKKSKKVKRYTRKKVQRENVVFAEVKPEIEAEAEDIFEEKTLEEVVEPSTYEDVFDVIEEEPDIFGEKYKDIENQIAELEALGDLDDFDDDIETLDEDEIEEDAEELEKTAVQMIEELDDDMPYEEEDIPYEEELEEDSIFQNIENNEYEELNLKKSNKKAKTKEKKEKVKTAKAKKEEKDKKSGILKNLMKLNAKDNKKVAEN